MQLLFVRHGESVANLLHVFSNRDLPHGLTDRGRKQAHALSMALAGRPIAQIYTSPLLRAVQTAEILSDQLNLRVETTDALREFDCGILEGRSDEESWQRFRLLMETWIENHRWEVKIEGGESYLDMKKRFLPFIQEFSEGTPGDPILIGHGGLFICMLPEILANVDHALASQLGFSNTGVVIAETGPEGLFCRSWCGQQLA